MMTQRLLASMSLSATIASGADGQEASPPDTMPPGNVVLGGAVTLPFGQAFSGSGLAIVGMTIGTTRVNRPGADIAFGIAPRLLGSGALAGLLRANVGVPLQVARNLTFIPSAGLSLVGALTSGGGGGARGYNGSLAFVYLDSGPKPSPFGMRVALAAHRFGGFSDGSLRTLEIGFVRRVH